MKVDRFVLLIIVVVLAAYFFPQGGGKNSVLPLDLISRIGVSLIFFFYGLKLNPDKIKSGLKNWRLHLLIQSATYLFFPLIIIMAYPFFKEMYFSYWLGFLFLAALPSTVSSSVVMVSIAKGNIPAAIFNASISGLIGIIVTPLWMGLFLKQSVTNFDISTVYLKLLTEILLPVVLGLLLQRFFLNYTVRYGNYFTAFDKTIILLIVYKSFASSFEDGVFNSVTVLHLLLVTVAVLILFFVVYAIVLLLSRRLGFDQADRITACFCGTKKSLVHGTVFLKLLFPPTMSLGIILLPLMLFHALQIFIVSVIASKFSRMNTVINSKELN